VFRTRSDTEVIVNLYRRYGLIFLSHLNGEFSFAIWK
jgi:asparagine synthase (glutamine-hydrolysing)